MRQARILGLSLVLAAALPQQVLAQDDATAAQESTVGDESLEALLESTEETPVEPQPQPEPAGTAIAESVAEEPAEPLPVIPVAEKPEPVPQIQDAPRPPAQIEEIVVTATKREQALRDIPASITALTGESMEKQGLQGVEDISRLVPGVTVYTPSEGATRVTIRGIAAPAATNATTGVLFGDVSFTDAYLPRAALDPNPFDLKSVEVLKGPQGTLFGAGALNGAIRYVPEPPKFGEWEGKAFFQYTSVEQGDGAPIYGAAVNLPVGETLALRIMGFDRAAGGWIDNSQLGDDVNELDQQGLRGILAWQPSEQWHAALTYAWQHTEHADFAIADNTDGRLSTDNRPRHSTADIEYSLVDLVIKRRFDWGELVSDTSYVDKELASYFDASSRLPGGGQSIFRAAQPDQSASKTWSQELRLLSADEGSPWIWTVGAFGWKQEVASQPDLTASIDLGNGVGGLPPWLADLLGPVLPDIVDERGEILLARLHTDVEITELALFGDLTRRFGDSVEVTVGGRLYQVNSGGTVVSTGVLGPTIPDRDGELQERGFNPKASLLWHVTDSIKFYTAASKGFRAGGIQPGLDILPGGPPPPEFFLSDTIWSYEAGLRTDWFGGAMRFDVTAFFTDWKDPQTFQLGNNGLTSFIDNAGGVESKGIEASLQTLLPWGFMLSASASWTDTVTTEPFTAQDGTVIEPGQDWTFAPHFQSAATLAWSGNVRNWDLDASVTHSYLGKAWSNLEDAHRVPVFDFSQLDLQFGVANSTLRWMPEMSLLVNNATDERGIANQFATDSYVDVTYIRPRAYTLRLSSRF